MKMLRMDFIGGPADGWWCWVSPGEIFYDYMVSGMTGEYAIHHYTVFGNPRRFVHMGSTTRKKESLLKDWDA